VPDGISINGTGVVPRSVCEALTRKEKSEMTRENRPSPTATCRQRAPSQLSFVQRQQCHYLLQPGSRASHKFSQRQLPTHRCLSGQDGHAIGEVPKGQVLPAHRSSLQQQTEPAGQSLSAEARDHRRREWRGRSGSAAVAADTVETRAASQHSSCRAPPPANPHSPPGTAVTKCSHIKGLAHGV